MATLAISNCTFSTTSENPRGFSAWRVLAMLSANPPSWRDNYIWSGLAI